MREGTLRPGRHEQSWRIPSTYSDEYGVLVQCGPPDDPYWWLLCPTTATLYPSNAEAGEHLSDCRDPECVWDDVHDRAAQVHHLVAATDG